jgi:hypothetical protein
MNGVKPPLRDAVAEMGRSSAAPLRRGTQDAGHYECMRKRNPRADTEIGGPGKIQEHSQEWLCHEEKRNARGLAQADLKFGHYTSNPKSPHARPACGAPGFQKKPFPQGLKPRFEDA